MSDKDFARQLRIPSPCDVDWESMIGNDRVRFCEHCQLSVHNIDFASPKQIKRLIARSKGRLCVNYLQPTVQKPPAPILYKLGRRTSIIAASAFSATLSIATTVAAAGNLKPPTFSTETSFATGRLANQQLTSGDSRLHGYVFDPTGAVIVGATVTLTNSETNVLYTYYTSGDGQYQFQGLKPGFYNLKVSSRGFDTSELAGLTLGSNDNNRIDQTLSLAPIEAEVSVTAPELEFRGGGAVEVMVPSEPLVKAALEDNLEELRTILLNHSNVNVRDQGTGYTALERAILNGNREMVQVLLWAKADVNGRDGDGETALMMIGNDTTSEIVWDLINSGAKINLRDDDGDTALISVAAIDNVEAIKVLLDAGAKVNQTNNEGKTALMIAAENGKLHNVRALILAGADVNARDKDGKTALRYATEENVSAVVRLLKTHGAVEFEQPEKQ